MFSVAEENYIKSIYHLQQQGKNVTTNQLADLLQTKPASVTDMLKKLEAKSLLSYQKYYGCRLLPAGRKLALSVVRRHRLWEFFLVNTLGFGWEEVHEIAEQLEHVQSAALTEKLDAFLQFPAFDPHGDPIPNRRGKMALQAKCAVADAKKGTHGTISAVGMQKAGLLKLLKSKGLAIGQQVTVKQVYEFDDSVDLLLSDGRQVQVSAQLASQLFITV